MQEFKAKLKLFASLMLDKRLNAFVIRAMNSFDINLVTLEVTKYSREGRLKKFMQEIGVLFVEVDIKPEDLGGMPGV